MTNSELDLNSGANLATEAGLAASGDESAFDTIFAQFAGAAWGAAFAAADAVGPAADALSQGFAKVLARVQSGKPIDDIRMELLRQTRQSALSDPDNQQPIYIGAHAREPLSLLGETKDRQATLAFTALSEEMRSSLWLAEAERLPITRISSLLDKSYKETEELTRQARANFRRYYVDAVKRDGLSEGCATTLDKLASYVSRTLPANDVAAVEHHLAECKDCRAIVMSLDDLEGRLRAGIPPLPAWARQQVADTWSNFVPVAAAAIEADREPVSEGGSHRRPALIGALAVAAAAAVALIGSGTLNDSSSKDKDVAVVVLTTTTALPTTTEAFGAVSTPGVEEHPTTTEVPATTNTTAAPVTTTTVVRVPTTTPTTVAPNPPATTTTLPARTLISLPSTPIGATN